MAEQLLQAGLNALKGYVALHVLTCLVPAFLLAGAIVSFVSRETIIGYLGSAASKIKSLWCYGSRLESLGKENEAMKTINEV